MKAIVLTKFGPPDVLQLQEVAKPIPKDNEILVKVHAASVFAGDSELRRLGLPMAFNLAIWLYVTFFRPKPVILGQELAGVVEAAGKDVIKFKAGDQVYAATGLGLGAYAEYKCMPAGAGLMAGVMAIKPANLSFAEAATVPVGGLEALHYIRGARIQRGEKVLINGAGGSIGTIAVQLAKNYGAEVTAVDSGEKLDMLRSIGANHVVDYTREDFTRSGRAYDVIIDGVGKSSVSRSLGALNENGRYVRASLGTSDRLQMRKTSTGSKQVIIGTGAQRAEDLDILRELIEAGQIKPVIDRCYPLEQMAEAHRYVDTGRKKGSVAVTVSQQN